MGEIDADAAGKALGVALAAHPAFAEYAPRLVYVKVFRGETLQVQYGREDRPEGTAAWEFQNLAIKEYRRLAGGHR